MDNIDMKPRRTVWQLAQEGTMIACDALILNKSPKTHSNETRQGSFF
jgi:hypothetical protein